MKDDIRALLLHSNESPVAALKLALENHLIWTERARSFKEATLSLVGSNPPHLVFICLTVHGLMCWISRPGHRCRSM